MLKTDLAATGRVNGMGEVDRTGSYVRVVYHKDGENVELIISEGCAANLTGELAGALAQREDAVLEKIMRNVRAI